MSRDTNGSTGFTGVRFNLMQLDLFQSCTVSKLNEGKPIIQASSRLKKFIFSLAVGGTPNGF